MELRTSYLESVQALPGNTPGEKFRNMAIFIRNKIKEDENVEFNESLDVPQALLPLVRIEAAKILKKHEIVTESLKSDDYLIVHRALQAHWYFNGSVKDVVNVEYLKQHLLPNVSLSTRFKVLKTLAFQLCGKDPSFAEELFRTVLDMYGVKQAVPLLVACSESFAYNAVVENRLVLPRNILGKFCQRNPNFVTRYLKLGKPPKDPTGHCIDLSDYKDFLSKLVKKHFDTFVEIFEALGTNAPSIKLSNKLAETFLKNGKDHLTRNPLAYIDMIPKKFIKADLMKALLPKLLPKRKDFDVEYLLSKYLDLFSNEEKVLLLKKAFKEVYDEELLAKSATVKPQLLRILPPEERIVQARIKMNKDQLNDTEFCYKKFWRCYLPTDKSIPLIQKDISVTSDFDARGRLLRQLIYTCKVNDDENALLEVLKYFMKRHKNEQTWQHVQFCECLLEEFDVVNLKEAHHAVLNEWLRLNYVKGNHSYSGVFDRLLECLIHCRLNYGLSMKDLIEMFVEKQLETYSRSWNIIRTKPEYERQCLAACVDYVSKKYKDVENWQKNDHTHSVVELVESIYDFNARHTKAPSRVERMSLKNYPWLLNAAKRIIETVNNEMYTVSYLLDTLKHNEKDLFVAWAPKEKQLPKLENGEALKMLKKNPQFILDNWQYFLELCQGDCTGCCGSGRFLRTLRWYNDIPMKFFGQCMQDIFKKGALYILSVLLDGHSLTTLIEPHVPKSKTIDVNDEDAKRDYQMAVSLISCVKVSNPPVPLSLIRRFCDEDYLDKTLSCLMTVYRRTPAPAVIVFAKKLVDDRVALRKHGIRLLCRVETLGELTKFFTTQWKVEKNLSIREVLFQYIDIVFRDNPGPVGWGLMKDCISALTPEDTKAFETAISNTRMVSIRYVQDYIVLLLETIDKMAAEESLKVKYKIELLRRIDSHVCDLLPEDFCLGLLRKFLFNYESESAENIAEFVITSYLCTGEEKLKSRMATVCTVFREKVKAHWNQPHPRAFDHFPVNYAVRTFVRSLIRSLWAGKLNLGAIESFLNAFTETLPPQQDAESYLLLVYAKIHLESQSPKEFSGKLVEKLPELIDTFSQALLTFMGEKLLDFFKENPCEDSRNDIIVNVIDDLMESRDVHVYLFATALYDPDKKKLCLPTYERMVRALRECDDVAVRSIIFSRMNAVSYAQSLIKEDA